MNKIERSKDSSLSMLRLFKAMAPDDLKTSYDLRAVYTELNIYLSINNYITTGDVTIQEQGNIINEIPISGDEAIEIKFNSMEDTYGDFHRVFFVYAVDCFHEAVDSRIYKIRFADAMGIINNDIRFSRRYNMKFEDIVSDMQSVINNDTTNTTYKTVLNKCNVPTKDPFTFNNSDPLSVHTNYEHKFVVPSWKPLKALSYLASKSLSSESSDMVDKAFCDCFFFQNAKGEFIFTSYKKMFENVQKAGSEEIELEKHPGNVESNTGGAIKGLRYPIEEYQFTDIFNIQSMKLRGMFGFTDHTVDVLNVTCEPVPISRPEIQESIVEYKIPNKHDGSCMTDDPYTPINYTEESLYTFTECNFDFSMQDDHYKKFILPYQKSIAIRPFIEVNQMTLTLLGASDLDIGKAVKINVGHDRDAKNISKFISEVRWVISSINHKYTRTEYKTYVTCFTPYIYRDASGTNTIKSI